MVHLGYRTQELDYFDKKCYTIVDIFTGNVKSISELFNFAPHECIIYTSSVDLYDISGQCSAIHTKQIT